MHTHRETEAVHHAVGVREHRRKFRIDGQNQAQKLATALKTLEEAHESLMLALAECAAPEKSLADVRAALRLLAAGVKPRGM